jgi:hypothetical protein
MIKLKTKTKVVVQAIPLIEDYAYILIDNVSFDGKKYFATSTYCKAVYDEELNVVGFQRILDKVKIGFSIEQATELEQAFSITGDNISERYLNLIRASAIHEAEQNNPVGLGVGDFELYEQPVIETPEEEPSTLCEICLEVDGIERPDHPDHDLLCDDCLELLNNK